MRILATIFITVFFLYLGWISGQAWDSSIAHKKGVNNVLTPIGCFVGEQKCSTVLNEMYLQETGNAK